MGPSLTPPYSLQQSCTFRYVFVCIMEKAKCTKSPASSFEAFLLLFYTAAPELLLEVVWRFRSTMPVVNDCLANRDPNGTLPLLSFLLLAHKHTCSVGTLC